MSKVVINVEQLKFKIIEELAQHNSSLKYRKDLANELNLGVDFINNIYSHNKAQIVKRRAEIYNEKQEEYDKLDRGMEFMKIEPVQEKKEVISFYDGFKPISLEDEYVPRTKADMENHVRLTDAQIEHIAEEIEKESESTTYTSGETKRYISYSKLKEIAARNFITISTAERYTKNYTSVKVDKEHRAVRTPDGINNKMIPQEKRDIVDDLLKTTTLTQYEIADIAGTNQNFVWRYSKNNGIDRPDEEDENVKKKTNKQRKELRKVKNEQESRMRRSSSTPVEESKPEEAATSIKDLVADIEVPKEAPVIEKKPEPIPVVLPKQEPAKIETTKQEAAPVKVEEKKPEPVPVKVEAPKTKLIGMLGANRNIHNIPVNTTLECVLVDGRHTTPVRLGVFEEDLSTNFLFDFAKQEEICENFLKTNLKFVDGVADRSVKLYCTGIQSPLVSFIKVCDRLKVNLTCMHYDTNDKMYHEQNYSSGKYPVGNELGVGIAAIVKTFGDNLYRYKCTVRDIEQNTNNLFVIDCLENINSSLCRATDIICTTLDDYKELFMQIIGALISFKSSGFKITVRKFNFNTNGEVVKNTVEAKYEC